MVKILTAKDLTHLPDMGQQLLFEYMSDLEYRHETLLGMAYIFVWISMMILLLFLTETTPDTVPFSSIIEILIPVAAIIFTLSVFFLVSLRKPWKYSFYNKRVLSARLFFLQHFNMDISKLTPSDIWYGVVVDRANQAKVNGSYLTFAQRINDHLDIAVAIRRLFIACWFIVPMVLTALNIAGITDITPFGRLNPDEPYASQYFMPAGWVLVFWIVIPGLLVVLGWAFKPVIDETELGEK